MIKRHCPDCRSALVKTMAAWYCNSCRKVVWTPARGQGA